MKLALYPPRSLTVCILVHTITCAAITFLGAMAVNEADEIFEIAAWVGLLLGLIPLAVIIAGLACRSWLKGFLLGVLFTTASLLAILLADMACNPHVVPRLPLYTLLLTLIPGYLLLGIIPALFLRMYFGWRIVYLRRPLAHPRRAGVEDLLLLSTITPAIILIVRVCYPTQIAAFIDEVFVFAIVASVFVVVGLLVPPITWWITHTRLRNCVIRAVVLTLTLIGIALVLATATYLSFSGFGYSESIGILLTLIVTSSLVWQGSVLVARGLGFAVQTGRAGLADRRKEVEAEERAADKADRVSDRWLAAVVVLIAILCSIYSAVFDS